MYIIGVLFYALTISSFFIFKTMNELLHQAIFLAPEVAFAIFIVCLYPLVIFLYHFIRRKNAPENKKYLSSQARLAASVSLSLGLIGTFEGLTEMVSSISKSMMTDGKDLSETMAQMVSSISSALASMSYAFITSIFGVASSVLIIIAFNYIYTYYREQKTTNHHLADKGINELSLIKLNELEEINVSILEKLSSCNQQNDFFCKRIDEMLAVGRVSNVTYEKILSVLQNHSELLAASCEYRLESNSILKKQATEVGLIVDAMTSISSGSKDFYSLLEKMHDTHRYIPETLTSIDTGLSEFREYMVRFFLNSEKNQHDYLVKIKKIIEVLNED
ncbi:hypothetical protein HX362_004370 [Salmonella enterica]|nr:hypothetical protein [Salmonella enterica]